MDTARAVKSVLRASGAFGQSNVIPETGIAQVVVSNDIVAATSTGPLEANVGGEQAESAASLFESAIVPVRCHSHSTKKEATDA